MVMNARMSHHDVPTESEVKMHGHGPYLVNPLFVHKQKLESNIKIIHSIVTSIPVSFPAAAAAATTQSDTVTANDFDFDGEIQIAIEECHQRNTVTRRVSVRSYGDLSETEGGTLHASFSLPITPLPKQHKSGKKDWICWATFDENTYLCVLTGPEKLRIFDVYPSFSNKKSLGDGGGGHTVSLPFEASGIFPLHGFAKGGLLIQRQCGLAESPVNLDASLDFMMDVGVSTGNRIRPPSTLRLGMSSKKVRQHLSSDGDEQLSFDSSCSDDSDINRMVSTRPPAPIGDLVPTLYTLHNPLDEPRPCGVIPRHKEEEQHPTVCTNNAQVWRKNMSHFCDTSERVIFVGKPRCFYRSITDIIVVTFHEEKNHHRIWVLKQAPPPPKAVPLWKLTSRNSSFGPVPLSASVSPFSDLQAIVSMTCIHSVRGANLKREASTVFLSTTPQATGDFILSLLIPSHNDEDENHLQCIELNPLLSKVGADDSWDVVNEFKLTCKSALPVETTTIEMRSFSIRPEVYNDNDYLPQRLFLRQEFGSHTPKAVDILLCGHNGRINVYRGDFEEINIDVPLPASDRLPIIGLSHSVRNRVDIICQQGKDTQIMRISCTLGGTRSSLTDLVLSAIGSALIEKYFHGDGRDGGTRRALELYFAIRSDCLKVAQFRSSFLRNQHKSDDIEWESLSLILLHFITIASGGNVDLSFKQSKRSAEETSNDDPWRELLQSQFHSTYAQNTSNTIFCNFAIDDESKDRQISDGQEALSENELMCLSKCKCIAWVANKDNNAISSSLRLFDEIHMLHEDLKIKNEPNALQQASLVANLLYNICSKSSSGDGHLMTDYMQHYRRFSSSLGSKTGEIWKDLSVHIPNRITTCPSPPCLYSWLETIIKGNTDLSMDYSTTNAMCAASGALLRFYSIFFSSSASTSITDRDRKVILAINKEGFNNVSNLTDIYSPTLLLPLMDALHRCHLNPPPLNSDFTPGTFELIGRNDLAQIKMNRKPSYVNDSTFITNSFRNDDPENDGLVSIEKYSAMLFPNDTRVHEAARMLRSSRPLFLRVQRAPEVIDHDYERLKQQKLALLCRRLLPLPVGRGMMTIGTMDYIPIEPMIVPKICLAGRIPPQNAILALEDNRCTSKHKMWPDFHNGVAAGLRLPLYRNGTKKLSRTFIVCNKPKPIPPAPAQPNQPTPAPEPDYTYGGFLLALGLRGHLSALSNTDICDYINEGPVTTAVGLMIGLAANKRGTCDVTIQKTICVHIPSLLPTSFRSIDLSSSVQTAAVAGVGLLCQGSSHRLLTEFLLNEMGKRPTIDQNTDDRESYTLCCGISLGMVNLCLMDGSKRSINDGLADLNIEDRLHRYIVGGVDENVLNQRKHGSDRANGSGNTENEKSSRIYEGGMINTDITAPGATLALGMIYHRSGSKSAASLVALPQTVFELDCVRPDFLFLRIVARSLILWDEVKPTSEWINSQIPEVVEHYFNRFRKKAEKASGLEGLATFAAMSMSVDSQGNDVGMKGDSDIADGKESEPTMDDETEMNVDYNSIRQAHAYITAGLCFSLGLRFAGTGNEHATEVIHSKIIELQHLRDGTDTISTALRPDMPTVELCLGSAAISLAMVMAGTGNLKVFRLLKALRWKCDMDVKYGNHMAYASAIGLLFLGGGTCTLGNEAADIAALLISFFPRYPIFTHDNRYHLQALRHLYALAIKERKVEAIDVDTNEKILLPMSFEFDGKSPIDIMTPSILLNRGKTCKIRVSSDRYAEATIDLKNIQKCNSTLSVFVKKKSGKLSYVQDPHGLRSFFSQVEGGKYAALDFIKSFIEDRKLIAYAKYMCDRESNSDEKSESQIVPTPTSTFEDYCLHVIEEVLIEEKTEAILTLLSLYNAVSAIENKPLPSKAVWELRLLRSFYQTAKRFELVDPHFVALLCEHVDKMFAKGAKSVSRFVGHPDDTLFGSGILDDKSIKSWAGLLSIWHESI